LRYVDGSYDHYRSYDAPYSRSDRIVCAIRLYLLFVLFIFVVLIIYFTTPRYASAIPWHCKINSAIYAVALYMSVCLSI